MSKKSPKSNSQTTTQENFKAVLEEFSLSLSEAELHRAIVLLGSSESDLRKAAEFIRDSERENAHQSFEMTVLGNPPVSKRPRAVRLKRGDGSVAGVRMYAPDGDDQMSLAEAVRRSVPAQFVPFAGEVEVTLEVCQSIPKSMPAYKTLLAELGYIRPESAPDWDNRAKIVLDSMRGIVFVDDGQVVFGAVSKQYSLQPRIVIRVSGRQRRLYK